MSNVQGNPDLQVKVEKNFSFSMERDGSVLGKEALVKVRAINLAKSDLKDVKIVLEGPFEEGKRGTAKFSKIAKNSENIVELPLNWDYPSDIETPCLSVEEIINSMGKVRESNPVLYLNHENKCSSFIKVKNISKTTLSQITVKKLLPNWKSLSGDEPSVSAGEYKTSEGVIHWTIPSLIHLKAENLLVKGNLRVDSLQKIDMGSAHVNYIVSPSVEMSRTKQFPAIKVVSVNFGTNNESLEFQSEQNFSETIHISGEPFPIAKLTGVRQLKAMKVSSHRAVEFILEIKGINAGTSIFDSVEIVEEFPTTLELPSEQEMVVFCNDQKLGSENFTLTLERSAEKIGFRATFNELVENIGGLKPKEEIRIEIPLFVTIDPETLLKSPLFLFGLSRPPGPLLETRVEELSLDALKVYRPEAIKEDVCEDDQQYDGLSFERQIIEKFSDLAVKAYNERNFDQSIEYCAQIKDLAARFGNTQLVTKYENIIDRIEKIRDFINAKLGKSGKTEDTGKEIGSTEDDMDSLGTKEIEEPKESTLLKEDTSEKDPAIKALEDSMHKEDATLQQAIENNDLITALEILPKLLEISRELNLPDQEKLFTEQQETLQARLEKSRLRLSQKEEDFQNALADKEYQTCIDLIPELLNLVSSLHLNEKAKKYQDLQGRLEEELQRQEGMDAAQREKVEQIDKLKQDAYKLESAWKFDLARKKYDQMTELAQEIDDDLTVEYAKQKLEKIDEWEQEIAEFDLGKYSIQPFKIINRRRFDFVEVYPTKESAEGSLLKFVEEGYDEVNFNIIKIQRSQFKGEGPFNEKGMCFSLYQRKVVED